MAGIVLGQALFGLMVLPFVAFPAPQSWPYLLAGMFLHAGYQLFLLQYYKIGDLTQVTILRGALRR